MLKTITAGFCLHIMLDQNGMHPPEHTTATKKRLLHVKKKEKSTLTTKYYATPASTRSSRIGELRTQKLKSHLVRTQVLNVLPFKAWSRSECSHACNAYCQGFLPRLFLHFESIHLHFLSKTPPVFFFPVLAVANTWFLSRPAE